MAMGTPWANAMSPIRWVCRIPREVAKVRMNFIHGMLAAKSFKVGDLINIFAGEDGRRVSLPDFFQQIGVVPRYDILHPLQIELLICLAEANDRFDADVAQVVHGKRHVVADVFAHGSDVLAEPVDAFVIHFPVAMNGCGWLRSSHLSCPDGCITDAGNSIEHVDAEVHFHPRQAHFFAFFGAAAIILRGPSIRLYRHKCESHRATCRPAFDKRECCRPCQRYPRAPFQPRIRLRPVARCRQIAPIF